MCAERESSPRACLTTTSSANARRRGRNPYATMRARLTAMHALAWMQMSLTVCESSTAELGAYAANRQWDCVVRSARQTGSLSALSHQATAVAREDPHTRGSSFVRESGLHHIGNMACKVKTRGKACRTLIKQAIHHKQASFIIKSSSHGETGEAVLLSTTVSPIAVAGTVLPSPRCWGLGVKPPCPCAWRHHRRHWRLNQPLSHQGVLAI